MEQSIGIIGGTGRHGSGLAKRWAKAGHKVMIGSRNIEKAAQKAREISEITGNVLGSGSYELVAEQADIVVVTVPYAVQRSTLESIKAAVQGKILVDTTVPLMPPKVMRVQLPPEGSAALCAAGILGESVRIVSAFHNVAAEKLASDEDILCDILVYGDEKMSRSVVIGLANDAGLRGLHAGSLANAVASEALTSVQMFINKHYGINGGGIILTGEITKLTISHTGFSAHRDNIAASS